jgi:hypothetical protein
LNTVQLVVDSKNTNSIYIDVNKTTFGLDSLSTSAECPSTREYSVIQQGAQWLGVLCIDDLLQIMGNEVVFNDYNSMLFKQSFF